MGIGLESARRCLAYGAKVMLCARGSGALEEAQKQLQSEGYRDVAYTAADVGDAKGVDALFDAFSGRIGRCDGVIHAAGVYGPIGPISQVEPAEWWDAMRINLFGTFLVARAAAKSMQQHGGRIVLYSGGGAATPFPNYTAYACSKVAVVRLTETIAHELAPDIEVNCVAPGFVVTRLHQQTLDAPERAGAAFVEKTRNEIARGGVPATVGAEAAAFLVSDAAKGITGKFVAAPYDGYREWPQHLTELAETDVFTLRRILPRERGMNWQ